jgi:sulfiredoxin
LAPDLVISFHDAELDALPRSGIRYSVALDLPPNRGRERARSCPMMRREKFAIANIYVPVKRRATLQPQTVQKIAQSMLEVGQTTPILVRRDGERFVLVEGLHRLEACKALGEETIIGYLVQARKH